MMETLVVLAVLAALLCGGYVVWRVRKSSEKKAKTARKPNPDGTGGPGEPDPPNGP